MHLRDVWNDARQQRATGQVVRSWGGGRARVKGVWGRSVQVMGPEGGVGHGGEVVENLRIRARGEHPVSRAPLCVPRAGDTISRGLTSGEYVRSRMKRER
jgi:hypothetical protein